MSMDIKAALRAVTEHQNLTTSEMESVMRDIMTGQATPSQIGGFLVGLRMKGETVDEITGAVKIMRELATPVTVTHPHLIDIVGTGGDSSNTFNISTTSSFVVAAAGGGVAKHGNRSVSSKSGSADILEALGVKLDISPAHIAECVQDLGIGFMFAPQHHSAMKHAITPRREMGVRTIFNILGPLTNPAGTKNQLIGVFSETWLTPIAEVLQRLGSEHVLIVHAEDGLDEISISGSTKITELYQGEIRSYSISPEDFGLTRAPLSAIQVNTVEESKQMLEGVLANKASPARDIISLNAGAAIYTAGLASSLAEGVEKASSVIASGAAAQKVTELAQLSQRLTQ